MGSSTITNAIYVVAAASTAVGDMVGDRIYWVNAEQDTTLPYCTYAVVSDPHVPQSFDASDAGQARVQFNVVDHGKADVLTEITPIRDFFDKYSSTAGMDGITIYSLNCTGITVFQLPEQDNLYQASFDAVIRYKDA